MRDDVIDKRRSNACAESHARENKAVRHAAFRSRNPAGHHRIRSRVYDRFADAQAEAYNNKGRQQARHAGRNDRNHHSENSPPDHAQHENQARANAISKASGGSLKKSIAKQESSEYPAQVSVVQFELVRDSPFGNGQIDPIQIRHSADKENPKDQNPSIPSL